MAGAFLFIGVLTWFIGANLIVLKSRRRLGKRGISDQRLAVNAFKEMKNFNGPEWLAFLVVWAGSLTLVFVAVKGMNGT